jgi:hypothetical protein
VKNQQELIDLLIRSINDKPDKLHGDYTPSVHQLIEIGAPALKQVLELMLSDVEDTRLRAQRVIEGITMAMYGFRMGHGWQNEQGPEQWQMFWNSLGELNYDTPIEDRSKSLRKWKQWLEQQPFHGE